MFTGIVRDVGEVARAELGTLTIRTQLALPPIGASVAVNGACLTVVRANHDMLAFDLTHETLERTNLGRLKPGDRVNLEPALSLDQPLDGHLVQGHVDGTGTIQTRSNRALETDVEIEPPPALLKYIAEKGSIAVDGASLTIARITSNTTFTVALIPYTLEHTIAKTYRPGALVNLEVDLLARYAERLLTTKSTK